VNGTAAREAIVDDRSRREVYFICLSSRANVIPIEIDGETAGGWQRRVSATSSSSR